MSGKEGALSDGDGPRGDGKMKSNDELDLETFQEFLPHYPLPIDPDSVVHGDENKREPDILCRLQDGRDVAFELTESIDQGLSRVVSNDIEISRWLRSRAQREHLPGLDGGALVAINFRDNVSRFVRQRTTDALFSELKAIPSGFEGEWIIADESLKRVVRSIRIGRGSWDSLEFQVPAFTSIADPIVERIELKFRNRYVTSAPLELLVHYGLQPCHFDENKVGQFIECNIGRSQFRRVWVFDRREKKVWEFSPAT